MTSYLTGTRLWTLLAKLSVVLVTSNTLKYFLFLLSGMRQSQLKKYLGGREEAQWTPAEAHTRPLSPWFINDPFPRWHNIGAANACIKIGGWSLAHLNIHSKWLLYPSRCSLILLLPLPLYTPCPIHQQIPLTPSLK